MDDKVRASSTTQWQTFRFLRFSEGPVPPPPPENDFLKGGNTLYTRLLPLLFIDAPPHTDLLKGGNTPYTRLLPLFFIDAPPEFLKNNDTRQNTKQGRLLPVSYIVLPYDPCDKTRHNERIPILVLKKRPDTLLTPSFIVSLLVHALILAAIFYKASKYPPIGTPQAESQPVEVVFSQPEASSGMVGRTSPEAGSGNHARRAEQANAAPPVPSTETARAPSHEEETPSLALPPSNNGLPKSEKQSHTLQHPRTRTGHKKPHPSRRKPILRPIQRPNEHIPSPFDHITDLSFNAAPAPRRKNVGRPGGSGAPIDFSIGPLVKNGQLNARYASRTMVKGVSDDYAAEIDAWIRQHLFYPPDAAARGEEGGSSVHVILDRSGMVLKVFETNSSGFVELDAATVGIFQGAQLPPVPPDMKDRFINFDVTVDYILIRN